MSATVLILHAPGTNRDREAALACAAAGGQARIVHLHALLDGRERLGDHAMLVLPGGFSYGDDLGAGRLWASALQSGLRAMLEDFVASRRPVLGICNGFQALVKAGLLPGPTEDGAGAFGAQQVTLAANASGAFVCRWVTLAVDPHSPCVFTRGLTTRTLTCPVAHGEGRVVMADDAVRRRVRRGHLAALRYVAADGTAARGPDNPNGSEDDIAGLCNPAGNVLGLMPHPEDHIDALQHPGHGRGEAGGLALPLFAQGLRYAHALRG